VSFENRSLTLPHPIANARAATPRPAVRRIVVLIGMLVVAAVYSLLVANSAGSTALRVSQPSAASAELAARRGVRRGLPAVERRTELPVANTVGLRVITFVDHTRVERFHHGRVEPRTLVTQIRYPAVGSAQADDVPDATPLTASGPFPLVVFGPGFAETPTIYARLLDAWARAGYVVAAPSFPLTQKHVPGGRREADLINQPTDMSFVITRMLAENKLKASFLHGLIAPELVAVAGQSDGAATALAAAYDPAFADARIRAAIILSGAELTSIDDEIPFPSHGPALLAAQGSRDSINEPSATRRYYKLAPRPKFLLSLLGATHLPPYTTQQPYLGVVEQVTIAFLDHFLVHQHASLAHMRDSGNVAGIARLTG
jgi:dienelactone hydrolase